jgi:hypothetical protein
MATLHITNETTDIQATIDSSQVGDTIIFHGPFHLEQPLTFLNNRDYYGIETILADENGKVVCQKGYIETILAEPGLVAYYPLGEIDAE